MKTNTQEMTKTAPSALQRECLPCDLPSFCRNNFYTGKLLTKRDLEDEQRYLVDKLRLHHLALHGWGVVCGLKVKPHPHCPDLRIVVEPGVVAGGHWTPRRVWHALMTLSALVELTGSLNLNEWENGLAADSLGHSGNQFHPIVTEAIANVRAALSGQPRRLTQLADLLVQIEPLIPANDRSSRSAQWVTSDFAGVWLLAGLLQRQGWPRSFLQSSLGASHGPRAITYGLAALALAVLDRFDSEVKSLDHGLALFAGWFGDTDLAGLRRFLAEGSPDERRELLTAIAGAEASDEQAATWDATFDWLAGRIIRDFAVRVRGFRQASRKFVVKSFLAVPGRIRVEETRIVIRLDSNPFHVALHISSMDEPLEAVSWLGGRRLDFQLEGL